MQQLKSFEVDWKFSVEDILYNVEQLVGKLPIKYIGQQQRYGDWLEVVRVGETEITFPSDNEVKTLFSIIDFINSHLKDTQLIYEDTGGDNYCFNLIEKPLA